MRLTQCICNKCKCVNECEYYEETVKPVMDAASTVILYDDSFTNKIKDVLEEFECEYFE